MNNLLQFLTQHANILQVGAGNAAAVVQAASQNAWQAAVNIFN